jgi:hypothetical protein
MADRSLSLRAERSLRLRSDNNGGEWVEEAVVPSSDPGRRCQYPECETMLSVYNSGVLCWKHTDEKARTRFDRRLAKILDGGRVEFLSWSD